jgi:hypothetical protein
MRAEHLSARLDVKSKHSAAKYFGKVHDDIDLADYSASQLILGANGSWPTES